jgi:hypothetical protein
MVGFDAELNEIWLKYYFKSLAQAWAQMWAQMWAQAKTMKQAETIVQTWHR